MSELGAKLDQAQQLINAGQTKDARTMLMRLLPKHASEPALNKALSLVCMMEQENAQGIFYAERAAKARPNDAGMQHNLAVVLGFGGKPQPAIAAARRAIELDPARLDVRRFLVRLLLTQDRLTESIAAARDVLALEPLDADASLTLAGSLLVAGDAPASVSVLCPALAAHPIRHDLACQLAFTMNAVDNVEPAELLEVHRDFGRRLAASLEVQPRAHQRPSPAEADRPLRIGFISPDFKMHAVAFFIEPVLERLDRSRFSVTCYDTFVKQDAVNTRLRTKVDQWRECANLRPQRLAEIILSDRIDILIDLAGHTTDHHLAVMHLKPAPVQMTYLGYCNTTGVESIDWRIVDAITDPSPEADASASERLARIDPCFICWRPAKDAPELSPPPCAKSDHITFGSFNNQSKLSDATVALWSRILNTIPASRLILKNGSLSDAGVRQRTLERFAAHAIDAARIDLLDRVPGDAVHLALYSRIDIALDPLPYNGTTTTCEALFMGVPVVTLAGRTHPSRVGASLLTCTGQHKLIARTEDEYIGIATWLAQHPDRLTTMRTTMRESVLNSPLCDENTFALRFGELLHNVWRKHCGESP